MNDVSKSAQFSVDEKPESPNTLKVKSLSARRKEDSKSMLEYRSNKVVKRATSISINSGLTYVMVKGKVQPSEKYIYKGLTPYTNTQPY